jgi:hypothetical protein
MLMHNHHQCSVNCCRLEDAQASLLCLLHPTWPLHPQCKLPTLLPDVHKNQSQSCSARVACISQVWPLVTLFSRSHCRYAAGELHGHARRQMPHAASRSEQCLVLPSSLPTGRPAACLPGPALAADSVTLLQADWLGCILRCAGSGDPADRHPAGGVCRAARSHGLPPARRPSAAGKLPSHACPPAADSLGVTSQHLETTAHLRHIIHAPQTTHSCFRRSSGKVNGSK